MIASINLPVAREACNFQDRYLLADMQSSRYSLSNTLGHQATKECHVQTYADSRIFHAINSMEFRTCMVVVVVLWFSCLSPSTVLAQSPTKHPTSEVGALIYPRTPFRSC